MLNCQVSMRWGLKKKPNFSGLSGRQRSCHPAPEHLWACFPQRHRADPACAGTGLAALKGGGKTSHRDELWAKKIAFSTLKFIFTELFSLIKTTGWNGSVLWILKHLWGFCSSGQIPQFCEMLKPEKYMFTSENWRNCTEKSTVTGSSLRSLPTSTTTATRTGGLHFAAQAGCNF